ncbi:TPA: ead/Ea22-like family protein [Klebsiella quasipneumoniae]
MTDITELAQSLKAAAENAIGAHERLAAYPYGEIIDISQHEGEQIDIDITDLNEFNKEANPVNILALVEALEKAQRANGYLREQSAEWERKAISNFEDCAEMSARVEELESQRKLAFTASNRWADKFREAEKRIADLESRTVKLPKRHSMLLRVDFNDDYHTEMAYKADEVHASLAAAGIKVEAE